MAPSGFTELERTPDVSPNGTLGLALAGVAEVDVPIYKVCF